MGVQPRKLLRATGIAAGIAALAGFGIGLAAGKTQKPEDLPVARKLPADLCARLGDVSALFPSPAELQQTGTREVRCTAEVAEAGQPTHSEARLTVVIRTHASRTGSTAADVARTEFDDKTWPVVENRPYPTKVDADGQGEDVWEIKLVTTRGDVVVEVTYHASPITQEAAQTAALAVAEKAVWEAR